MSYRDVYIAEETMHERLEENRAEVEHRRLVQRMEAGNPRWYTRLACWLGCRIAAQLIATGKALERASLKPAGTLKSS